MDRVNGADWVDIGGGRRGFRSQNKAAGVSGTEVTAVFLNNLQEEILKVIEEAGLDPSPLDMTQLWQALNRMILPGFAGRLAWLPVLSVTTAAPPVSPALGDTYVIPDGASGGWTGHEQKLAIWIGADWAIVPTKDGLGVSLPDGRIFQKVDGAYVEKIAADVQSGKWNFAVAGGHATSIAASLTPPLKAYRDGLIVHVRATSTNTGAVVLNINEMGERPLRRSDGTDVLPGDIRAGEVITAVYNSALAEFRMPPSLRSDIVRVALKPPTIERFTAPGAGSWTVPPTVTSIDVEVWGGGGGAGIGGVVGGAPSGGGGGAYARKRYTVNAGDTVSYVVGAGGAGGSVDTPRPGQPGGASSATVAGVTIIAGGGGAGVNADDPLSGNHPGGGVADGPYDVGISGQDGHGFLALGGGSYVGGDAGGAPLGGPGMFGASGSFRTARAPGGGGAGSTFKVNDPAIAGAAGEVRITYVVND